MPILADSAEALPNETPFHHRTKESAQLMSRFRQTREDRFANPNIALMAGLGLGLLVPVMLFLVDAALGEASDLVKLTVGFVVCLIILVPTWVLVLTRRRR